ncbi:Protein fam72a [Actinomortierella wolfii]|nr:Protein fam72a [Actinomortierella wolfii]
MPHRTDPDPRLGPSHTGSDSIFPQTTHARPPAISSASIQTSQQTASHSVSQQQHHRREYRQHHMHLSVAESATTANEADSLESPIHGTVGTIAEQQSLLDRMVTPTSAHTRAPQDVPNSNQQQSQQQQQSSEDRQAGDDMARSAMWMSLLSLESGITEEPSSDANVPTDRHSSPSGSTIWIGDVPLELERTASVRGVDITTAPRSTTSCPQLPLSLDANGGDGSELSWHESSTQTASQASQQQHANIPHTLEEHSRPMHVTIEVIADDEGDLTMLNTPCPPATSITPSNAVLTSAEIQDPSLTAGGPSGMPQISRAIDPVLDSQIIFEPGDSRTPHSRGSRHQAPLTSPLIGETSFASSNANEPSSLVPTTSAPTDNMTSVQPPASCPSSIAGSSSSSLEQQSTGTPRSPSDSSLATRTPTAAPASFQPHQPINIPEQTREERSNFGNNRNRPNPSHQRASRSNHIPPSHQRTGSTRPRPVLPSNNTGSSSVRPTAAISTTTNGSSNFWPPGSRYPPPRRPLPSGYASSVAGGRVPLNASYTAAATAAAALQTNNGSINANGVPSWGSSSSYRDELNHRGNGGSGSGTGGTGNGKTVFRMDCSYCSAVVCLRGMKAMLLADTSIELYSTDHPPGSVQLVDKDYTTLNCKCRIRDVACRVCGNVIGYHITQPCRQCLDAPNNGHFWMFHTEGVVGQDRLRMDLGQLVQALLDIYTEETGVCEDFDTTENTATNGSVLSEAGASTSFSPANSATTGTPTTPQHRVTGSSATVSRASQTSRRRHTSTTSPQERESSSSPFSLAYPGPWRDYMPTGTPSSQTRPMGADNGTAGFDIGEQSIQPDIWDAWLSTTLPRRSSIAGRARAAATAAVSHSTAQRDRGASTADRPRQETRRRRRPHRRQSRAGRTGLQECGVGSISIAGDGVERNDADPWMVAPPSQSRNCPDHRSRRRRLQSAHEGDREGIPPHVLLNTILNTNNTHGAPLDGPHSSISKTSRRRRRHHRHRRGDLTLAPPENMEGILYNGSQQGPHPEDSGISNAFSVVGMEESDSREKAANRYRNKAFESIMNLNLLCFLQPLKWDQLPHPDFDIDLDPATMGDEPLFAAQWVGLVTQAAQTAALNMWMALNQEFEEYYRMLDNDNSSPVDAGDSGLGETLSSFSSSSEAARLLATSSSASSTYTARARRETTVSRNYHGQDYLRSDSYEHGELSDEEKRDTLLTDRGELATGDGDVAVRFVTEGYSMYDNDGSNYLEGSAGSEWEDGDSDVYSDDGSIHSCDMDGRGFNPTVMAGDYHLLNVHQHYYYHDAATLETIAKAAATAAAADAAAAANSLVFGRRLRRDYEMMCR